MDRKWIQKPQPSLPHKWSSQASRKSFCSHHNAIATANLLLRGVHQWKARTCPWFVLVLQLWSWKPYNTENLNLRTRFFVFSQKGSIEKPQNMIFGLRVLLICCVAQMAFGDHVDGTLQWFSSVNCTGNPYRDAWSVFSTGGRGCFYGPRPGTCTDGTQNFCATTADLSPRNGNYKGLAVFATYADFDVLCVSGLEFSRQTYVMPSGKCVGTGLTFPEARSTIMDCSLKKLSVFATTDCTGNAITWKLNNTCTSFPGYRAKTYCP